MVMHHHFEFDASREIVQMRLLESGFHVSFDKSVEFQLACGGAQMIETDTSRVPFGSTPHLGYEVA